MSAHRRPMCPSACWAATSADAREAWTGRVTQVSAQDWRGHFAGKTNYRWYSIPQDLSRGLRLFSSVILDNARAMAQPG